jgi:hypothetical protein
MESRFKSFTSRSQRLALLLLILVLGSLAFYFVTIHEDAFEEFEDDYESYKEELAFLTDQVQYWDMKNSKKPLPVPQERFFIWDSWSAGQWSIYRMVNLISLRILRFVVFVIYLIYLFIIFVFLSPLSVCRI